MLYITLFKNSKQIDDDDAADDDDDDDTDHTDSAIPALG